jgi:large repetitive protein
MFKMRQYLTLCNFVIFVITIFSTALQAENIALFDNSSYVDTAANQEVANLSASLATFNHPATTFAGTAAADFTTALAGKTSLVIPELEVADLNAALDSTARTVITNFVNNGGNLIVFGDSSRYSELLLDALFAGTDYASLAYPTCSTSLTPNEVDHMFNRGADVAGTIFATGVPSLVDYADTCPATVASLPTGANNLYTDDSYTNSAVFSKTEGNGMVYYMGWDWTGAPPNGSNDKGWLNVLDSAVSLIDISSATNTSELGGTSTYNIVLRKQPTADVTFSIGSSDTTEGTVLPTSVTFTSGNWNETVTITITGVDDGDTDGNATYSIQHGIVTSTDPAYSGIDPRDITLLNLDDETAAIAVSKKTLNTSESGTTDSFTVRLTTEPSSNVTVTLQAADGSELSLVTANTLTFTSSDFADPQTVTVQGEDDNDVDSDTTSTVSLTVTASGGDYTGVTSSVFVINADNDTRGFVFSKASTATSETLTSDSFTVRPATKPTETITVAVAIADSTEATLTSSSSLEFTTVNWLTAQPVSLTGLDDAQTDGNIAHPISFIPTGGDYGAESTTVTNTNSDDEVAGITLVVSDSTTDEDLTTASFTVVLDEQPTATVTVTVASDDATEGSVTTGGSLTFTTGDWNSAQTVIVTGVNDDLDDGDITYTVTATANAAGGYTGVTATTSNLTNADNDAAGVVIASSDTVTNEAGDTANFTVVLAAEPTATVTVTVVSNDSTEGSVTTGASLSFTTGNWSDPQAVVVTGQNDDLDDGSIAYSATATANTAGGYSGENDSVNLTNNDNDASTIAIVTSDIISDEAGGTANFTVALTAEPTATVTVTVASNDSTEGSVTTGASLTFATGDWNIPQAVVVTGQNDDLDDGNITYTVTASANAAGGYTGVTATTPNLTNNDNDASTIAIVTSDVITDEAGDTANFTVALTAEPTATVTVTVASDDSTEGSVTTGASLTFTTGDWNIPQNVVITGQNDDLDDGDITYTVTASANAAGGYTGVTATTSNLTNNDNDASTIAIVTSDVITDEAGDTANFTVALTAEPTATVTVTVASNDSTEGSVTTGTSLTFTAGNWSDPQPVVVTGQNDDLDDGDITYTVTASANAAGGYTGITATTSNLTNNDNDASGISIITSNFTTDEAADTANFTVVLTAKPTANVTVTVASDDSTEGLVTTGASLIFTTNNWNSPQPVIVTGQNDDLDDGTIAYTVTATANTAGGYNGQTDLANLTNADNDASGIIIATSDALSDEAANTASFTVVLTAEPTANVTVTVASDDSTEGSVTAGGTLTFTSANWDTPQPVTVTGQNDDLDDGDIAYTVTATANTAGGYTGQTGIANLTNNDNDASGISIVTSDATSDEAADTASFTVVLTAEPTANVTVTVASDDSTEGSVTTGGSLTFTSADWDTPQPVTVTGQNDDLDDGDIAYTVTATANTAGGYSGETAVANLTNTDNDAVGISIVGAALTTTEDAGTDTFTVALTAEPTATVTVAVASNDSSEGSVTTGASLTFTTGDWNIPQAVVVTGQNDDQDDGDIAYTVTATANTAGGYSGETGIANITNTDNNSTDIIITGNNLTTFEATTPTASFTVNLNSQPTANVVIGISSDNINEGTVSTSSLTFTTGDWNIPQTVTVTGVDDAILDGNTLFNIVTAAATSGDGNYNGVNAIDVSVTNTDNEVAGLSITTTDSSTSEAASTGAFSVVLTTQPTANVTVSVASSDSSEGTVTTGSSLTFTTANWDTTQNVVVTGVNDDLDDGDIAYTVTATANTAGGYNGETAVANLTNTDNDSSGITLAGSVLTTTEAGGTANFTVTLTAEPTANVTVTVLSNDATEGNVTSGGSLTFTAANWNTPQTVTVTGADDNLDDGNIAYTVTATANSAGGYSGENATANFTNTDNDQSGITVTGSNLSTTEAGGSDSFTLVLTAQPTANVVIAISSADTSEASVSTSALTFTSNNWNSPQTVRVNGVDDDVLDGNISFNIVIASATSSDSNYQGINPGDILTTNADDETANDPPVFTGTPTITGSPVTGTLLSASNTGTSDPDGDTVTLSYQWLSNGSDISAATNSSYTLQTTDASSLISLNITANDGNGGTATVTTASLSIPSTDLDGDGILNEHDNDIDGDGIPNAADAFPTDPNESSDLDGDGIGDNSDPDFSNDLDNDGILNEADNDMDGDGVANSVDAFPADPAESSDLDGDGIGDNADSDRDGDGIANGEDSFPDDTDNDGIDNKDDNDIDGDGVLNEDDAFPLDASETTDTDNDGIGDNADDDRDGDGIANASDSRPDDTDNDGTANAQDNDKDGDNIGDSIDAFPLDPNESLDSDGDGIGDNSDTDRDGDGIPDSTDSNPDDTDNDGQPNTIDTDDDNDGIADEQDAFPLDATESSDLDGDGIGDNADTDRDGDGLANDADANPDDTDNDGIPNSQDTDRDGDGTADAQDAFPLDKFEDADLDGDGIGNNADTDTDGDGTSNSTEGTQADADNDGIADYLDPADTAGVTGGGDSDADGITDEDECTNFPDCEDSDNDGLPDYMDADTAINHNTPAPPRSSGGGGGSFNGWFIFAMLVLLSLQIRNRKRFY